MMKSPVPLEFNANTSDIEPKLSSPPDSEMHGVLLMACMCDGYHATSAYQISIS
jgi:hypothetical protein